LSIQLTKFAGSTAGFGAGLGVDVDGEKLGDAEGVEARVEGDPAVGLDDVQPTNTAAPHRAVIMLLSMGSSVLPCSSLGCSPLSMLRPEKMLRVSGRRSQRPLIAASAPLAEEGDTMRILVVEDADRMAALLGRGLRDEGYAVDVVATGEEAVWMASENPYDAVLLDVMLPDLDGFEVCRRIRAAGQWAPVLMLTARDAVQDRVRGLDVGADDYLTKPFAFAELLARMRALVRRGKSERPQLLAAGDLTLDPASREVRRGEQAIALTPKEFSLLEFFMRHPGEVLTRTRLIEHVWDFAFDGDSNVVEVYVRYLREKIDRPFGKETLETVRGVGYRLRAEAKP
jgi:two-component system OmpR family response regulator